MLMPEALLNAPANRGPGRVCGIAAVKEAAQTLGLSCLLFAVALFLPAIHVFEWMVGYEIAWATEQAAVEFAREFAEAALGLRSIVWPAGGLSTMDQQFLVGILANHPLCSRAAPFFCGSVESHWGWRR